MGSLSYVFCCSLLVSYSLVIVFFMYWPCFAFALPHRVILVILLINLQFKRTGCCPYLATSTSVTECYFLMGQHRPCTPQTQHRASLAAGENLKQKEKLNGGKRRRMGWLGGERTVWTERLLSSSGCVSENMFTHSSSRNPFNTRPEELEDFWEDCCISSCKPPDETSRRRRAKKIG